LSEGARKRLQEFADLIKSLQEYALTHSPSELADELLRRTGYLAELQADGVDAEERVGNVREFIGHLKEFEQRGGLREFLEEVALMAEADTYSGEQERVALMTLHSAKGLEFDYVFLVGMEENLLPHARSLKEGTIEEERRLCYVGLTRAKERVYLSFTARRALYGSLLFNAPSRFIWEIPKEDIEVPYPWELET
jgi:DNA helicase-2/ATP-dependent DNA helicase PcrA